MEEHFLFNRRVQQDISNICENIRKLQVPKQMYVILPDVKIELSASSYIWSFYQAIEQLHEEYINSMSLVNTVYKIAGQNDHCATSIGFNLSNMKLTKYQNSISIFDVEFTDYINRQIAYFKSKNCRLASYYISFFEKEDSHANIIFFVFNDKRTDIYLYEPHGADTEQDYREEKVDIFMRRLAEVLTNKKEGKIAVYHPKIIISCLRGIQAINEPGEGYCMIISFFWLYCLLNLSRKYNINKLITVLEQNIINQGDINDVLIKFAAYISNETFTAISKLPNYKRFEYLFIDNVKELLKEQRGKEIKKKQRRVGTLEGDKRLLERTKMDDSEVIKKYDGENCRHNTECLSGYCHNKKCKAYHEDKLVEDMEIEEKTSK